MNGFDHMTWHPYGCFSVDREKKTDWISIQIFYRISRLLVRKPLALTG